MPLTRYGLREWLTITLIAAAIAAGLAWMGWWWAILAVAIVWAALVSFFRDPLRRIPADLPDGAMLSPADGTISAVEHVAHHPATDGPAVIIRIFLSVLNVHINRSPAAAEVVRLDHRPGRYLDARNPESAKVNESNLITLRLDTGETIGVKQISGAIARRIVCPLRPSDRLASGQRFGMIKFGSTTELILPRPGDVAVHVSPGRRVKAGIHILAVLAPPPSPATTSTSSPTSTAASSPAATTPAPR